MRLSFQSKRSGRKYSFIHRYKNEIPNHSHFNISDYYELRKDPISQYRYTLNRLNNQYLIDVIIQVSDQDM